MTYQIQKTRIRLLFSTLADATSANTVLLEGEKWQEKDAVTGLFTGRTKTGKNGVLSADKITITGTAFNDLPFDPGGSGGSGTVTNVTGTAPIAVANGTTTPTISIDAATISTAGSMSATDKTKLDSIVVDTASVVRKLARNNSGASIPKGSAVCQTGSSGTTLTVALADASVEATAAQTLGLTQETIANNSTGYVVAVGLLDGINTSTLTEGQIVWLSETAGGLTTTRPTQPAHGVVCGYCVKQGAGSSGILYVKVDNGLELNELHDVLISSVSTGQVLRRASDGLWKNHSLAVADVSGLGTAAQSATTDFATAAQGAKADTAVQPAGLTAKADLVGGLVPTSQIPSIALVEYLGSVANQAAMLALRGQGGDWCIRTDTATEWVIVANNGASLADWIQLPTGIAPVSSINGQTGAVTLGTGDIAESGGNLFFTAARAIDAALTGFTAGSGAVAATDTILQAIQKLDGNDASKVGTVTTGITGAAQVTNVISLSQANYDAIATKNAQTLYIITG